MAAFLFGVVVGWVSTFAMWFIWSFGWISGLFGGAIIGAAAVFVVLTLQWALLDMKKSQNRGEIFAWFKAH
ncbi:hypothetical protein [Ruegeria atlantica]|uniref:hypothetical protein n=1 Tax=Ruegeria atlantica TaxID=81569 RepID=UPI002494D072|nr:hypothetical protein [Ruegeria atlantica]